MNTFKFTPIGYFHTIEDEKYLLPKQAGVLKSNSGKITLLSNQNFEQSLDDLIKFDRVWVIFTFHKNQKWKPKVLTPHGPPKRGVFATRSPHRPNNIGLSCLKLVDVKGLNIFVADHDLLNDTPILDIKPYLAYADSFPEANAGWIDGIEQKEIYTIYWAKKAVEQMNYLKDDHALDLSDAMTFQLLKNPFPTTNNRIKKINDNTYVIAIKTWRFVYSIDSQNIKILEIQSGYDKETIIGIKISKWNDVSIHQKFLKKFT